MQWHVSKKVTMFSSDAVFISFLIHAGIWGFCAVLVWAIRPRLIGLTVAVTVFLAAGGYILSIVFSLSAYYGTGPNAGDLLISLPVPIGLVGLVLLPTRKKRIRPGHCACGYNLVGNESGACPECGLELVPLRTVDRERPRRPGAAR